MFETKNYLLLQIRLCSPQLKLIVPDYLFPCHFHHNSDESCHSLDVNCVSHFVLNILPALSHFIFRITLRCFYSHFTDKEVKAWRGWERRFRELEFVQSHIDSKWDMHPGFLPNRTVCGGMEAAIDEGRFQNGVCFRVHFLFLFLFFLHSLLQVPDTEPGME